MRGIESYISPPNLLKLTAFSLLTLSLFLAVKHLSSPQPLPSDSISNSAASRTPPPTPPRKAAVERTGIVDSNGAMTEDFVVGEYDPDVIASVVVEGETVIRSSSNQRMNSSNLIPPPRIDKLSFCGDGLRDHVPCIWTLSLTDRGESYYERHCPSKALDCLVPRPKGYKLHIPWPLSRDQVWFDNVPHNTRLVEHEGGQNWISRKDDKFIFAGGGGADKYLDQISKMIPEIAFGQHVRVALDVGCGVASFGAFLLDRNVTTLSIAPNDAHENQIQFALERGVPAMIAAFGTRRLLYPSQAFDLIHCSRCGINWTRDDGILLLEVNRMLRAGGYFVWAAHPYKHEENLQEQWQEMEDLTGRICWELVKKEGYIAIWRKPLNNSCNLSRDTSAQPPVCDIDDEPDNVWYVKLKACITRIPETGYGANITAWPTRLHYPPDRLFSIEMDAYSSRKDIYKAESKYWNDIVSGYIGAFKLKGLNIRNVLDMRAGYGGFAAALHDFGMNCWVMNVVPVSGANTLPVIYDRGLVGVVHDWCEPFDTYPRTYDFLNAAGVFSVEQKRCNITNIMLEMDRILRPGGRVYIRDSTSVIPELQEIANAMGWVTVLYDTGEGPHASWKLLNCEKRL